MKSQLITADSSVDYQINEIAPVIVAALAWVIAVGGTALFALMICGWRGSKQVVMDWFHGRATFYCR